MTKLSKPCLGGKIFTVKEVIDAGVRREEVVKTLIVRTGGNTKNSLLPESGMGFAALCLRGGDRVDFKKVRTMFGNRTEMAKPEEVLRIVGVPVGAVCPILIGVPVYIDRRVMGLKEVHIGSGDLTKGLEMNLADLLEAIRDYHVSDLTVTDLGRLHGR